MIDHRPYLDDPPGPESNRSGFSSWSKWSENRRDPIEPLKELRWVSVWLGVTILAMPFDQTAYLWCWRECHGVKKDILGVAEYMSGYPIHLLILAILFSCANRLDLIKGYLTTMVGQGLVSDLVKLIVGRARPGLKRGPFHFEPLSFSLGMTSFPSGDACAAMALATILGIYFPRSKSLFWGLGLAAGLARAARGRHFLSDVVFGAGLGCGCASVAFLMLGERFFRFTVGKERLVHAPNEA